MNDTNETMFDDPEIARQEREIFGDKVRPVRPALDAEGDFIVAWVAEIQRDVDLKTGFAPVDIIVMEGITGALGNRTERVRVGQLYGWAVMHQTAKNQLARFDPPPSPGERIAIRRGRNFVSTVEGPSHGRELVGWDVVMPDRDALGDNPDAKPTGRKATTKETDQ